MHVQSIIIAGFCVLLAGCTGRMTDSNVETDESRSSLHNRGVTDHDELPDEAMTEDQSADHVSQTRARRDMVEQQIHRRGIRDERVLDTMRRVPRHRFVPKALQGEAYEDNPLPIGHHQTISQPYIVALMTELVRPQPTDRALDIGTGCGYQAAVLSELVREVFSIEIVEPLVKEARKRLNQIGYTNVDVRWGDGYAGWEEHAPFQIIIVAAAPDHVPQPLLDQLAVGGRMVIPLGRNQQELVLIEKLPDGSLKRSNITPVAFVPMTGTAEKTLQR